MRPAPGAASRAEVPAGVPVPMAVLSAGVVTAANDALRGLLGDDPVGRTVDELFGASAWQRVRAAAAAADPVALHTASRVVEVTARLSDAARPDDLVAVVYDVTAYDGLARELADLARFPDMNPGPVLRLDLAGSVLLVNPAARAVFGDADLIGRSWLERCPGMTPALWAQITGSSGRITHEAEIDGATLMFTHLCPDEGDSVFVFGADITQRRAAERQLAEIARFPDMNPGPVLRLDLDGNVLLANRAAQEVFGGDVLGGSWLRLYPAASERWPEILRAGEPLEVEARLADRDYTFAHRMDPHTSLVFVYGTDVTRQKQAERALRQSEKMATLGTLAAGVAHELNNPAAATRRAADHMGSALAALEQAHLGLDAAGLDDAGRAQVARLAARGHEQATASGAADPLTRSDLESEVEDWLDDHDVEVDGDVVPALVELGLDPAALDDLAAVVEGDALNATLEWAAAAFAVFRLAYEIHHGSARISEIVGALKAYSYLGQAPVQSVDLHEALNNTLVILRHKLKAGIEVRLDYCADLPPVPAYGSELNEVWTNLLDNAIDAMGGTGRIVIRTRRDDGWAVVVVEDNGPGIPPEVRTRVFDPFFTTKPPGKGTGLGLSTTYSVVTDKHRGHIDVDSEPGATRFTVRLPLGAAVSEGGR